MMCLVICFVKVFMLIKFFQSQKNWINSKIIATKFHYTKKTILEDSVESLATYRVQCALLLSTSALTHACGLLFPVKNNSLYVIWDYAALSPSKISLTLPPPPPGRERYPLPPTQ